MICTSADGVLKSTDGGFIWQASNNGLSVRTAARIVIDPSTGVYYLGTYFDGIYKSYDAGESWQKISHNITNARCQDISFNARSPDTIFTATASGIFRSTDRAFNWEYLDFLNPDYDRYGICVKVDPNMANIVYAGFSSHEWGPENIGIARSTDFGDSWFFFYDGLPSFTSYNRIDVAYDDSDRHRIFLASTSGLLYSDDFGEFWLRQESLPQENIRSLSVSPANPAHIYAASQIIYKSANFGDTWENLQGPPGDNYVNEIACDPLSADVLYCCRFRQGIYKSLDGGSSWIDIGNNLPHIEGWFVVSGIAVNPLNSNTIFANVYDYGIFVLSNGGESWQEFNEGLRTNYFEATTIIDPQDTNRVFLATSGQSVWSITRTPTSIYDEISLPDELITLSNYPNPFNTATNISFSIYKAEDITLSIYNLLGQHVETIFDGAQEAGRHSITWDATAHPSGVYFARLKTTVTEKNIKVVLLK